MKAKSILVVEDDRDIRRNVHRLLESEGYLVIEAENGQRALDWLNETKDLPNLIILDLTMPIMDGFQFRDVQQRIPRLADIPILVMTADGRTEEKRVKTQAKYALKKPADVDDILRAVKEFAV